MHFTTMYKAYTYFNCRRRVDFPKKVKYNSKDDFIEAMETQLFLEEAQNDKSTRFNKQTIMHYADVLKLIEEHHGKFHRWKRDINMAVIIVEATFEDIDDLIAYKKAARFPCVTTRYVYSVAFKGRCTRPFAPEDYTNLEKICEVLYEAAFDEFPEDVFEFYSSLADFLYWKLDVIKYPWKIKSFKNMNGHLVIDIQFSTIDGFRTLDHSIKVDAASE